MDAHMSIMALSITVMLTLLSITSSSYAATNTSPQKTDEPLKFTYSGAMGPDKWGSLNPNFTMCSHGKAQSPIDIVTSKAVHNMDLKPLIRKYHPSNVTNLINYKYTVGIEYPEHMGEIIVHGKPYPLKQMHWHSPSEHRINGKRYDAELHMVHVSDDGKIVAVATLFKLGRPDPVLGKIYNKLNELAYEVSKSHETAPIAVRDAFPPKELRRTSHKYYIYTGSSSVPPCAEGLIYIVLAKARPISSKQVEALKAPLDVRCKYNARPCQPINGRKVEVYEEV